MGVNNKDRGQGKDFVTKDKKRPKDALLTKKTGDGYSNAAENSLSRAAEGSSSKSAEGSLSKNAEGYLSKSAEGSTRDLEATRKAARKILKQELGALQVIPPVAVKLLKLTNDEASSFADLSLIIETEPSLSLEVLRLVNSAFYNFSNKITSIKRAATVLGFSAIRQIALSLLFFKKMIKANKREFDQIFFWQHCLFVATLSKTIATHIKHPDPDAVYAAGLLHDIGKIILESHGQLTYSDFLQTFPHSSTASIENEKNYYGLTHEDIGAVYCQNCDLPESIINVVSNHHSWQVSTLDDTSKLDVAIVAYANFIAWLQGVGSVPNDHFPVCQPEIFTIINAYNLDLEAILEQVDKEINSISNFYNFRFPNLNELRSNLIETIFKLNFSADNGFQVHRNEAVGPEKKTSLSSLTLPHHSLDPDEFFPWTLEALQKEFHFDRLLLLNLNPERRSLVAQYCWPKDILSRPDNEFEIKIPSLSGQFLTCMRKKQAALIDNSIFTDRYILNQLQVDAFFCLPILIQNRIACVLYIDNFRTGKPLHPDKLPELKRVTNELGIALANSRQFEREKHKAKIDPLTGLNNKGVTDEFLFLLFTRQQTNLKKLAVGFIDIDHFKQFNDTYGHQSGDEILKSVSDILKSLTRPNDFIGRYGGEEFLFILTDSSAKGLKIFSERIRTAIEKHGKTLNQRFPAQSLTVSIGAVMYHVDIKDYKALISAADSAMYQAKKEGRNRVIIG